MTYFPRKPALGGPLGMGEPSLCPGCGKWFVPTPGMENTSCCVAHGPGSCCHYSETEITAPTPSTQGPNNG